MKATLRLHYYAPKGAKLQMVPSEGKPLDMSCDGEGYWSTHIELHSDRPYLYHYRVIEGRHVLREEWGDCHTLTEKSLFGDVEILDHWSEAPTLRPLYSSMFRNSIFARTVESMPSMFGATHYIEVEAPLPTTERLSIVGASQELGGWLVEDSLPMSYLGNYRWGVALCASAGAEQALEVRCQVGRW